MFKAFGEDIKNSDIIDIIRENVDKLYDTQQTIIQVPNSSITKEIRNTCHQPFHLEYYLDVNGNIRRENFYKNVKCGDILYGRVLNYRSSGHYYVNIFAALGNGKRRNLIDCDVVAHMKSRDTDPKVEDSDSYGNWEIKTQLLVEVLYVKNHGGSSRLHVGTKGSTLTKYQREEVFLGKVAEPFPITEASWDERSPSYSKALLKCKTFNRAKSTKILCQLFNLNMNSSYANSIRMQNFNSPQLDTENDSDIEVIDSGSDSEEIQITKVELSEKQKTDNLIRQAIFNYRNGNYKHVLGTLESVFEIDETNTMAIVALAVTKYKLEDSIGAVKLLTRALDLEPDNIEAIVAKASILCNDGDLDEALQLLEPTIKEDPKRTKAHYNKAKSYFCKMAEEKALIYIRNGNEKEAIVLLNKIIQINPANTNLKNYLSALKKKAYSDPTELITLSSDEEDENVMDTSPTEVIRSPSREQVDLSDDDQEDNQMATSFHLRAYQYLQNIDGCESNDLSVNQKQIYTDTTEIGDESSPSERESDICDQIFDNDITESLEFENMDKNKSVVRYDDKLERTDYEKLNVSKIENPSTMLSENLKESENSQITVDSLEKESTNNNITDSKENENMIKKIPKKRTLPKLKRLPIGYMVEKNSLRIGQHHNQIANKQEESSKKNQSQTEMSNEKEMRNSPIESDLSNDNIIENKAQNRGNYNDYDLANTEGTSHERKKSYEKNKILNETEENKSENNEETQYFKITNTQDIHKSQELSRKDMNFDKNRENNKKKKYEVSISNKSSSTEKHKISHSNKEEANEKSKNKKPYDKSSKSSRDSLKKYSDSNTCTKEMLGNDSEISANNVKQLRSNKKLTHKSKTNIKSNHQITDDYLKTNPNDEDDIFGVKGNSLNTMNLDDFDLPDIETSMYNSHSEHYDQQNTEDENINNGEYDELNELRKDLEGTPSIADKKGKKEETEDKNRKIYLNNGKSQRSREFLQKIREENEKTEKRKSEISNRSTKEIKRNTAKESHVKQNDGKRGRVILLAEAIVPPSEIRKRRRRKNEVLHEDEEDTPKKKNAVKVRKKEDEEETPKKKNAGKGRRKENEDEEETPKKKSRKSKNSEIPSEVIAGPSTPQTPISSMPIKCSSVEVQTPTHNSSSIQEGPRFKSRNNFVEALRKRHASVSQEIEHIDENDIKYIGKDIEEELFNLFNGDTGTRYKVKYRSLVYNIRDPNNETLFRKILNNEVSPRMLVRMESNELASEERDAWLKMRKQKELDAIKQTARENVESSKTQLILKNHKGELEITNDYGQEAIESLNELPEDLSIDLNIMSLMGSKSKEEKSKQKKSKR